jgi:SAM-dependent methyltransferase
MPTPLTKSAHSGDKPDDRIREYFESSEESWEDRYRGKDYEAAVYRDRQSAAVGLVSRFVPSNSIILEFGCGTGELSQQLQGLGYRMICTDLAHRMTQHTRANTGNQKVLVSDIQQPPFKDQSFDAIVLIGVISYVQDPTSVLEILRRLLKPNGHLIISSANRNLLLNAISDKVFNYRTPDSEGAKKNADARRTEFFKNACKYYKASNFNALTCDVGYELLDRKAVGYGQLRIMGKPVLPHGGTILLSRILSSLSRIGFLRFLGDYAFSNIACFRSST